MNSYLFGRKIICIVFVSVLSHALYGQPDSVLTEFSLKELLDIKVTTASRTSQMLKTAPATVIVITREQIRTRGYQSLLDVMYDLPDMKVDDKIYSGIRNSFTLRGTQGSEKMVILMDGIIISSPSGEAMPVMENYPVHIAEQIEVVYGPASALYGANAVSCVINIITRKAKKSISIDASSAAGSYGYTNTSLFISKKLSDYAAFTISGQYSYDRGVDYSKLYKSDSLFSIASYSSGVLNTIYGPIAPIRPVKARYEAPMEAYNIYSSFKLHDFTFSFFRNYFKLPTAFGNNTSNSLYNRDAFMAQSISTANATYKKEFDNLTSSTLFTVSEYTLNPKSNYRNLYTAMEAGYKYSTCSVIRLEEQFDYRASKKLNFSAGISYDSYTAVPQSGDLETPVNKDDYLHASYLGTRAYYRPEGLTAQFYFLKYTNLGTYFQSQFAASEKINITLGARYDRNSRYGSTFNPRMGLVYEPSATTTIKALFGSAFLAPTPSDSYSQYGSFHTTDSGRTYHSFFLHLPNPDLAPITSQNVELSVKQNLSDNLILTIGGYYTALKGLHQFSDDNESTKLYNNEFNGIPVDYIEVFTNHNRQKNYGGSIQVNGKYSIGKLRLNSFASLSYVNGVFEKGLEENGETEKDIELDFISPVMIRLGTDIKGGKFTCSPRLIIMGRQNLAGISDSSRTIIRRQTIPGYALLNISCRYTGKLTSVFVNVSNALDQHYRNVGFNMNLNNSNTEIFNKGQRQDPIRITGGLNFNL
jgi:outer membrane receptor for ferrienterochelin and colicin